MCGQILLRSISKTILFRNKRAFKKLFLVPTKTLIHQSLNWESKEELQVLHCF